MSCSAKHSDTGQHRKTPNRRPTARVGRNNRSQTVTLPLEFRFNKNVREVYIRREGASVVLTPRPMDWSGFFASGLKASSAFMADACDQAGAG
ncbi:antitoxin [Roseateles sp.]|uniref:antitoxin n=1 Tax=Roseateles sp. TaxID=1971397 RepID=UPI0039269631